MPVEEVVHNGNICKRRNISAKEDIRGVQRKEVT